MKEVQIGGSIEDGGLAIVEAGAPELDSAQDLHALAFAGDRDLGRMTEPAPGSVQGGVLPETGFVGKNQRPILRAGFGGRRGGRWRCQRACWRRSARASTRRGRCTEKPRA